MRRANSAAGTRGEIIMVQTPKKIKKTRNKK
jgi:hypothetical protein